MAISRVQCYALERGMGGGGKLICLEGLPEVVAVGGGGGGVKLTL